MSYKDRQTSFGSRSIATLLALVMVFALLTAMPLKTKAAPANINLSSLDASSVISSAGEDAWNYVASTRTLTLTQANGHYTLINRNDNIRVVVDASATNAEIILNSAHITSSTSSPAFRTSASFCTITVSASSTITSTDNHAFRINEDTECYIGGSGNLTVSSTRDGNVTNGFRLGRGYTLTIAGSGNVTALSSGSGQGIASEIGGATLILGGSGTVFVQGSSGSSYGEAIDLNYTSIQMSDFATLRMHNNSSYNENHTLTRATSSSEFHWIVTNATVTGGGGSGGSVGISIPPGNQATIERVAPTPVTLIGANANGISGMITSTRIVLEFDANIVGLTANDITISSGTGSATKGALSYGASNTLDLAISNVSEGTVSVAINAPAGYTISSSPQTVNLHEAYTLITAGPLSGVTSPIVGETPSTSITETVQYTGTVTWSPADPIFDYSTIYTATVTLTAKSGYTFSAFSGGFENTNAISSFTINSISPTSWLDNTGATLQFSVTFPIVYGIEVRADGATIPQSGTFAYPSEMTGYGYNPWKAFNIFNTGANVITNLDAALADGTAFTLDKTYLNSLDINSVTSFNILANNNLTPGTYTDTVTVSGDNILPYTFTVSFTVTDIPPTDVSYTATQTGGASDTADSTGIVLTFSEPVTGLTAGNVSISNGTGSVTKGALTGSGTTWTIGLTGIAFQGDVTVSVANFGTFKVTTLPQTVDVYKDLNLPIHNAAILGVTAPAVGVTPVAAITETEQYTGTVTWSGSPATFDYATAYTATITLTPKAGFTLTGVSADFFTVAGATTVSNSANSGVITAVFPSTDAAPLTPVTAAPIGGVTSPVGGAMPSMDIDDGTGFTASMYWNGNPSTFDYGTVYYATIELTAKNGYTFSDYTTTASIAGFTVNGVAPTDRLFNSNSVLRFEVSFPATGHLHEIAVSSVGTPEVPIASGGSHTFTSAISGYASIPYQYFHVYNIGTGAMTNLSATLSGTNASDFTLNVTTPTPLRPTLISGGVDAISIKPNDGLTAGTYSAIVTLSDDNITDYTFTISITVSDTATYTIAVIDPATAEGGTFAFDSKAEGYAVFAPTSFTIRNTGTSAMTDLAATLSGADAGSFTFDSSSLDATLATGGISAFTIGPNHGLAAGTYTATVTITDTNMGSYAFDVNFIVTASTAPDAVIDIGAIAGVTAPIVGATPVTTISETAQYSGTVTWSPVASSFAARTVYSATITITPKTGYTLTGLPADFFTVAGANSATNAANSGVITVVFPATGASGTGGGGYSGGGGGNVGGETTTIPGTGTPTTETPDDSEKTDGAETELATEVFTDVNEGDWFAEASNYVYSERLMIGVSDDRFDPNGTLTRGMIVTILYRLAGEPSADALANPFSDVADDVWYTDAIKWAAANNIVLGYGNGRFGPSDPVTKEQLAALIYRNQQASGKRLPTLSGPRIPDAYAISAWAIEAVTVLNDQGLFEGIPGTDFKPQQAATRAEIADILYKWLSASE